MDTDKPLLLACSLSIAFKTLNYTEFARVTHKGKIVNFKYEIFSLFLMFIQIDDEVQVNN